MPMSATDRIDMSAKITRLTVDADANDVISLLLAIAAARAIQSTDTDACVGGVVMCAGCFGDKAHEMYETVVRRWRSMQEGGDRAH